MVRLFERACIRAGIKAAYSKGYNPRPKLSLPLPKSVGIEVDDDILCIGVETDSQDTNDLCTLVTTKLSEQLPDGINVLTVKAVKGKTSIHPCRATYLIAVREEYLNDELKNRIESLPASVKLNVQRQTGSENLRTKTIDVRPFVESIKLNKTDIEFECKISPAGSIRVDEILSLLELDVNKLRGPIRRTKVQWQVSES